MTTIAFLGLGNMGGPMAANLVAAGHTVHGFDPVPAPRRPRRRAASRIRQRRRGGGRCRRRHHHAAQRRTCERCYAEILPAAKAGALFIDTSTISVDDARAVHKLAAEHGFAQLDAPVSGGVKGAVAGTLAFMVGGRARCLRARANRILEPMAGKIIHCGDSGAGQAAKVCNNMVLAVQQIAIGEAFVLAEKLGLSAQSLFDVITGATGNCWAVHTNCPVPGPVPTSPANNDFKPGFATALMNKDLHLAMDGGEIDRLVGTAGQPCRADLRKVCHRACRSGFQRSHQPASGLTRSGCLRTSHRLSLPSCDIACVSA